MAKKNEFLSKKERRVYSRLIARKLESLGMQDGIGFVQFKNSQGAPIFKKFIGLDGKVLFESPVGKLSNPFRNLIKRLRSLPRVTVQEFLNSDVGKKKEA